MSRDRHQRRRSWLLAIMAVTTLVASPVEARPGYIRRLHACSPSSVAVDHTRGRVYAGGCGGIEVYDADSDQLIEVIDIGVSPMTLALALNPVTNKLYVTLGGKVWVLDVQTKTTNTITLTPSFAGGLAVNPVTNRIYVTNWDDGLIWVIDGSTDTLMATFDPAPGRFNRPLKVAVDPTINKVYFSDDGEYGAFGIYTVDGATHQVTNHIPFTPANGSSYTLAVNTQTHRVYVTPATQDELWVIDGRTGSALEMVRTGVTDGSFAVGVNEGRDRIYLAKHGMSEADNGWLLVIDGQTNREIERIAIAEYQKEMAINPVTHRIYLVENTDVSVISEDVAAPASQFSNRASVQSTNLVHGTASDNFAGIGQVQVSYTSNAGSGFAPVTLEACSPYLLSCSWKASLPQQGGAYLLEVIAIDAFGNRQKDPDRTLVFITAGS